MGKLFLLVNQLSRHNIFAPYKKKNNWYWKQQPPQQTIIVPTCTILHPRLYVITKIYVQDILKNICNRKIIHTKHPIITTDADYDYILDEIERREKIKLESNVSVNSDEEQY